MMRQPISICAPLLAVGLLAAPVASHAQEAEPPSSEDPRIGLAPGWHDAGQAIHNLELVASVRRPEGFVDPERPGAFEFVNSDLAFRGDYAFVGSFHGFQIWDISDPASPRLRTAFVCPGGQGDVSVYGDLLFMSVEEPRARYDCGLYGGEELVNLDRFRGVRIFDIGDLDAPVQATGVQTCRGSHTHTVVPDPADDAHVYVYNSGIGPVRPPQDPGGGDCSPVEDDPNTSLFRIEVIRVPLAAPAAAMVVSEPRILLDPETGEPALWPGGPHGPGTQTTARTDQCHDITAYPEIGLAAGACAGNGILIDISDPVSPVRVAEVSDPNFAYWHSATFNNDGTRVLFTDEWGGGVAARCRTIDPPNWGANAIYHLDDGALEHAGYYKLPVPQSTRENCVAHNGSLVPVPGRDIMAQAWLQGGVSLFDFTDPENPFEIAYFDRGPLSADELLFGGHWSAYWYNGHIYATESARGLDVLRLVPSEHLTRNEIDAAELVRLEVHNAQTQTRLSWPAAFPVTRAYLDQAIRHGELPGERVAAVGEALDRAERLSDAGQGAAAAAMLEEAARALQAGAPGAEVLGQPALPGRLERLAESMRELAAALR